jgi:hypothetical protein
VNAIPRRLTLGLVLAFAVFTFGFGLVVLVMKPNTLWTAIGLALFAVAFIACGPALRTGSVPPHRAVLATVLAVAVPVFGSLALDPVTESFSSGAWYVSGVVCIAVELLLSRRILLPWIAIGALVAITLVWSGPSGLVRFGIFAALLFVGVVTLSAWAIRMTAAELSSYSDAAREAASWRAAQDAYHSERQVRLATTALVAAPMLRRVVEADGHLTEEERAECRLLEQTIRDEIRGRRLLNRAMREQVMAQRRRGAIVQVNDDGGLDDIAPRMLEPLLTQVADAIAELSSDRIIIRTAPIDSPKALTVVAMSTDPIAAALGLDDGEDHVDLWLELDRPVVAR